MERFGRCGAVAPAAPHRSRHLRGIIPASNRTVGGAAQASYAVRKILTAAFRCHAGFGPIGPRPPSRPISGSDVRTYRTRYYFSVSTSWNDLITMRLR